MDNQEFGLAVEILKAKAKGDIYDNLDLESLLAIAENEKSSTSVIALTSILVFRAMGKQSVTVRLPMHPATAHRLLDVYSERSGREVGTSGEKFMIRSLGLD